MGHAGILKKKTMLWNALVHSFLQFPIEASILIVPGRRLPSSPLLSPSQTRTTAPATSIDPPPVAMAADGRMRCRSRRMQGRSKMTSASGAEQMKPHHGIRGLVKSGGGNGKSGDRRIETHGGASGSVGHIVKPGAIDSEIKPSSADSAKDAWIYVHGCRIKRVVILD